MAITPVVPGNPVPVMESAGLTQLEPAARETFVNVVEKLLGDANAGQLTANQAIRELAIGQTDNLHDVMLAVAKADLAFRTVLEVRNRLTDAYQEVMRMQV